MIVDKIIKTEQASYPASELENTRGLVGKMNIYKFKKGLQNLAKEKITFKTSRQMIR